MRFSSLPGKIALVLVIALVPLVGHIAATLLIVRKPGSGLSKAFWIAVVWIILATLLLGLFALGNG